MKTLEVACGKFEVSERDDYTLALMCDGLERKLYCVTFHDPYYAVLHVLAESEDSAISQAYCVIGVPWGSERMDNRPVAVRVPMFLRGWSRNAF